MIELLPDMPEGVSGTSALSSNIIRPSRESPLYPTREWVAHTLHALAWMVPGELAMFGLDELDRAKEWAVGQG
jgi:hypothetical protein